MLSNYDMSEFKSEFEKDYEMFGAKFTIQVQNLGHNDLGPAWLFALIVKGNVIQGGPYTPHYERELTLENVANQLASFWGHGEIVQAAQDLEGSPEWELDQIVMKCATFMHGYFLSENQENTDYDIVKQYMDEEEWVVILRPNYMPGRLMEFYKKADRPLIELVSYVHGSTHDIQF